MWFELPADDPERAIAFYEKAFRWTIVKWEGPFDYWQITKARAMHAQKSCPDRRTYRQMR